MKIITTTLTTDAVFSDDGVKRYLLRKTWDSDKPKLAIIMLAPSEASAIELDTTTQLVINNAARLGYGTISVLNLFATVDDYGLRDGEDSDDVNLDYIVSEMDGADTIVYAPGVGKSKNKKFQQRQVQVLCSIASYEDKLHCLCDANGNARLQHPLSPSVRTWHLSPLKIRELVERPEKPQKKNGKAAASRAKS